MPQRLPPSARRAPKISQFQRDGQMYDPSEMTSYHTTDPDVPTVFQSLRDGAVFLKINGSIQAVPDGDVARIAMRYRVPELLRPIRYAARAVA